jgi:aldose 1-epimerase
MQTLNLHNETWSLALLPQWGGRVARLMAGDLDILTPIQARSFDPLDWPRAGAYPLLPYSNRLREARLNHDGIVHALPAHPSAAPHTLHGVSHTRIWHVVEHSATHALLACDYHGEHWPWPVRFEQCYALDGQHLRLAMSVTNHGDTSMPAGLGLHPYFQRHRGMRARFFVGKDWQIDSEYMPTGIVAPNSQAVELDAEATEQMAVYGSEWDGRLEVQYPNGDLLLSTDAPLTHLVAFAPTGAPYLCLEPVSHLADAFNSSPTDWPEQGTHVLEPGQTLSAHLTFTWTAAQS